MPRSSTWIPADLKGQVTFFSEYDLWDYGITNINTCKECKADVIGVYQGNELRSLFPDLVILNEDEIAPCVHPNCACVMRRLTDAQLGEVDREKYFDVSIDEVSLELGGVW